MKVIDESVPADHAPDVGQPSFDAFVSYSHAVDDRLAPAVQQGLQTLGKPWHRRRVLHVFRDQTSLTASPALWPDIERALATSHYFILLASPEAAASSWVRKELHWWLEHRPRERLLIAITDGSLAWDGARGDFDPERSSALPEVLRGCFAQEPLWVDLCWARAEAHLSLRDPRFRDCVADLAAPLHGCPKDELIGEDIRNHRRAIRLARGAAVALALLAAAAVAPAVVAVGQRNAAQHQTRLATSRQLAAQSQADAASRLDTSLLLSRAAWRTAQTPQALAALLQANTASPQIVALTTQQPPIGALATVSGAGLVATGAADGSLRLWRPGSDEGMTRVAAPVSSAVTGLALGGNQLVVGDAAGQVGVYSLSAHRWTWPVQRQRHPITAVGIDATGSVVASAAASGSDSSSVELSRAIPDAPPARFTVSPVLSSPVTRIAFDGGHRFVVGAATGQVFAWSLMPPFRYLGTSTQLTATDGANIGAYSPDMTHFGVSGRGESWSDLEATRPTGFDSPFSPQVQFPDTAPNPPLAVALAPGGRRLAVSGSTGVTVLDALGTGQANAAQATTSLTGLASPDLLAFPDQDHVVGTDGSTLAVWDLRQLSRIAQVSGPALPRISQAVPKVPTAASPDGHHATWVTPATFSAPSKLACWDLRSLRELRSQPLGRDIAVSSLAYDPAGTHLVTAGGESLQLWVVRGGCPTQPAEIATAGSDTGFEAVGFRGFRTVVAVDSNETVRVIDAFSGRQLRAWKVHYAGFVRDPVVATAVSGDGDFAAIGLDNGRLVEVNTHTGAVRSLISAQPEQNSLAATSISHIAWSPNGRDVAAIEGNGNVVVLNRSGQTLMSVQGLGTESLQFLLGGSALMGVDAQGTAHVWDVASGSILSSFPAEQFAPVGAVVFPDVGGGTSITPVGTTKLLITDPLASPALFDFALPRLLGDACRVAGRQLTRAEIQHLAAPAPADAWSCR